MTLPSASQQLLVVYDIPTDAITFRAGQEQERERLRTMLLLRIEQLGKGTPARKELEQFHDTLSTR